MASLQQLTGPLSPQLAQRLLNERSAKGPFASWDDMKARVPGLGDKKLEKLQAGFMLAPELHPRLQKPASSKTTPSAQGSASQQLQKRGSSKSRSSTEYPTDPAPAPKNVLAAALGSIRRSLSRQLSKRRATADDSTMPVFQPADGPPQKVGPLQAALITPAPPADKKSYAAALGSAPAPATIKAAKPAGKATPVTASSSTSPASVPAPAPISDAAFSDQVASAQQQRQARASLGRGFSLKDRSEAPAPPPQARKPHLPILLWHRRCGVASWVAPSSEHMCAVRSQHRRTSALYTCPVC